MRMRKVRLLSLTILLAAAMSPAFAQQGPPPGGGRPGGGGPMMGPQLQLSSTAFGDGTTVPDKYTCAPNGTMAQPANMTSPPLAWVNAPAGTQSFVLLLHDPDAHARKAFNDITHWMIFNIPADATSLPEGVKADSTVGVQAANITGQPMYFGPCAPPGPSHHYTFELFALDTKLDLPKGASRDDVQKAMDGHVLTGTVLIGLFHRTSMGPPPQR
ncbi:MAG TPA: YbhB/YbcL family Raf kinase inhibitor-like protein [Candidatus Acidoferrales bacterium]|nr:YbhB/YbcL family Raf kinase inhibitor-like protein [Candidatus Acidoferrales bacterium]